MMAGGHSASGLHSGLLVSEADTDRDRLHHLARPGICLLHNGNNGDHSYLHIIYKLSTHYLHYMTPGQASIGNNVESTVSRGLMIPAQRVSSLATFCLVTQFLALCSKIPK